MKQLFSDAVGWLDRLAGGDRLLFWLPVSLMAAAVVVAFLVWRDGCRYLRARRQEERRAMACRLQAALDQSRAKWARQ